MSSRLPSLNALRAFEATARLASVTRAADELAVTQSAVSRHIRTLEEDLDVVLFRRVHRAIKLTPEGAALAKSLGDAFDIVARGVEQIRSRPGELRLRVLPTIGTRWLLPRLARFEAANPDLKLRVSVLWEHMRPDDTEHDIGILQEDTQQTWDRAQYEVLFPERLTPVCAPAYLARFGPLQDDASLTAVRRLHCSGSPDWQVWSTAAGLDVPGNSDDEIFDTMDMALRAAEGGRGVAIADLAMVETDLAIGRLVRASPMVATNERSRYIVVWRESGRKRKAVDRLVHWLLAEAKIASPAFAGPETIVTPARSAAGSS